MLPPVEATLWSLEDLSIFTSSMPRWRTLLYVRYILHLTSGSSSLSQSHFYHGIETLLISIVFYAFTVSSFGGWSVTLYVLSLLYSPMLFNPQASVGLNRTCSWPHNALCGLSQCAGALRQQHQQVAPRDPDVVPYCRGRRHMGYLALQTPSHGAWQHNKAKVWLVSNAPLVTTWADRMFLTGSL